ncbi:kynurenine/alpha-aminoadipate aminotransferase, mitochondrial-like isoform X2 [Littorina saxatilis]|uniref:kynurenine/alpha-aminoadipate aminotransferase, mitochondrial-like isoform X2 n=1 Tax=Littorina saxatilis TaxID=31220 RepID=UPI0038B59514
MSANGDGSVLHVDERLMRKHLQYGMSEGYPDLRQCLIDLQRRLHSPPTCDSQHTGQFDLVMTQGANDGINMAFNILLNEGDWALTEEATYPTALSMTASIGANVYPVAADEDGMLPKELDRVLSSWDQLHPGCRTPKIIYTITSAGNPTGVTWSLGRKRAVYELARSHDLIILEDDAYYFLQFNRPLIASFLSMDVDGRVLRADTFSKILGPGLRLATMSGPAPLLDVMRLIKDCSSTAGCGLAQAMLVQLLRHWGYDGFLCHVDSVMGFYKQRADMATRCAERQLSGIAEWKVPSGGMFLWLRVLGVKDTEVIVQKALQRHVILVAGTHFTPANQKSGYIRLSFATVTEDDCEKAFKVLADVIREEQGK